MLLEVDQDAPQPPVTPPPLEIAGGVSGLQKHLVEPAKRQGRCWNQETRGSVNRGAGNLPGRSEWTSQGVTERNLVTSRATRHVLRASRCKNSFTLRWDTDHGFILVT